MLNFLVQGLGWLIKQLLNVLLDVAFWIVDVIVQYLDIFPRIPSDIVAVLYSYFDMIFSNSGLVGVFLDLDYLLTLFPLYLLIRYADKILKLVNFALSKIPFFH